MAIVGGIMVGAVAFGLMFGNDGDAKPYLLLGIVGLALLAGSGLDAIMQ